MPVQMFTICIVNEKLTNIFHVTLTEFRMYRLSDVNLKTKTALLWEIILIFPDLALCYLSNLFGFCSHVKHIHFC